MSPDQVAGLLMLLADLRLEVARVSGELERVSAERDQLATQFRVGKTAEPPSAEVPSGSA